ICEGTASGFFDLGLVTGEVKPALQSVLEHTEVGSDRLQIVVGRSHPWYERQSVHLSELTQTNWVMRESGSGTQQMFERALQQWGILPSALNVVFVLTSSEMVKAVVESGVGATAISRMMIQKELQLDALRFVNVINGSNGASYSLEMTQSILMLKHRQRFQTRPAIVFEELLVAATSLH
ncbi:MAG TPA: LysR substrate-binding domain-containing protein, partial [Allocoleopsis sp.]